MLNRQEKLFVLTLCAVLFLGASLDAAVKKYPFLFSILHVMENEAVYPKININSANLEELVRIPYIGNYTAQQIIARRQTLGPFRSLEELKSVKGIKEKNFERFRSYLSVR
jgi:competence ComEA-like helix-hairpin-helix protein